MLDKIDLTKYIEKSDYQSHMAELKTEMGRLQRQARELQIPLLSYLKGGRRPARERSSTN
jgi:hypothetical protein